MSVWELRQAIESNIPAWVLLIPVALLIAVAAFGWWVSKLFDGKP